MKNILCFEGEWKFNTHKKPERFDLNSEPILRMLKEYHKCDAIYIKREWLADYNRRTEQRCSRSNWETLLAFMLSVFPLQPSCHVAYCSSDSWSPQSRSLLA